MQNQSQTANTLKFGAKWKAFATGAVLAASALVGGFAIVVWNRKALSGLRQHHEPAEQHPEQADENEE